MGAKRQVPAIIYSIWSFELRSRMCRRCRGKRRMFRIHKPSQICGQCLSVGVYRVQEYVLLQTLAHHLTSYNQIEVSVPLRLLYPDVVQNSNHHYFPYLIYITVVGS